MEFNKTVSNPMLVGAIELLKAEDSPEHRSLFVDELQKASLLAPAVVEPVPIEDAEGKLTLAPGSKIQFSMLAAPDKKRFSIGFTDMAEYRKWQEKNEELPFFALRFEDYARILLGKDARGNVNPAVGIVINPFGSSIIVPKEMVAGIMAARAEAVKRRSDPGRSGK